MLKVQFGILWTCPRTQETLNTLNMLKVSPNYEPHGLIVWETFNIFNMFNIFWVLGHVHHFKGAMFNISQVMLKLQGGMFNMTGVLGIF